MKYLLVGCTYHFANQNQFGMGDSFQLYSKSYPLTNDASRNLSICFLFCIRKYFPHKVKLNELIADNDSCYDSNESMNIPSNSFLPWDEQPFLQKITLDCYGDEINFRL